MIKELTNIKQSSLEIKFDNEAVNFTDLEINDLIHMISTDLKKMVFSFCNSELILHYVQNKDYYYIKKIFSYFHRRN